MELGYLTHLVEKDDLQQSAMDMAIHISGLAPLATVAMKSLCDQASAGTLTHEHAREISQQCNSSSDLQEGLLAAKQKRTPLFSGV
jgi:1,4-dihydroxy-2-naphthoyl-CoA synthase